MLSYLDIMFKKFSTVNIFYNSFSIKPTYFKFVNLITHLKIITFYYKWKFDFF